jgi:hypothetical protein
MCAAAAAAMLGSTFYPKGVLGQCLWWPTPSGERVPPPHAQAHP